MGDHIMSNPHPQPAASHPKHNLHRPRAGTKERKERIGQAELDAALLAWEVRQGYVHYNPFRRNHKPTTENVK